MLSLGFRAYIGARWEVGAGRWARPVFTAFSDPDLFVHNKYFASPRRYFKWNSKIIKLTYAYWEKKINIMLKLEIQREKIWE